MAHPPGLAVHDSHQRHSLYRCSSIYPDSSTADPTPQFDFDFGFDQDTEKAWTVRPSMSSHEHDPPSNGSETALKTPRGSTGGKSEKSMGEQYVISWDGPYDPANPQNWPSWRKWTAVMIVSGITFVTPLASSMFAPAIPQVSSEFHNTSQALSAFAVSVYILGFGIGPLVLSPSSELWGRNIVFNVTNLLFVAFTIACALSTSLPMLTGFRFLAGCAGSAALTIGGGTIADVMPPEKRGKAMAVYVMGPVLGPSLGPVAGGFLAQAVGWRWIFWLLTIVAGLMTILTFIFLRETYAPKLLRDKARKMQKETGQEAYKSMLEIDLPARVLFLRAITRPSKMLLLSPVVLGLSCYMALVYSYIYLLFTTFPLVFEAQYGFSTGTIGLAYLGMGIGMVAAAVVVGYTNDRQVAKMAAKSGERKPEYRLPIMMLGSPLIAAGLFWYGWSAEAKTHWIVPIIGTVPIGAGLLFVFTPLSTYLIDAFTTYAASALAAATVLRSLLSAVLPLAGPSMYNSLGFGWGNSLLAFIAVAFGAIPLAFFRYGERLRERFPLNL
ncbi:MAG: hypothetical protein LQ348_007555 [Seirophora lacunosa]|nr:MAG: hypothetical protein LQ348_007555 [Seirophora lacunosa]